MAKGLTYFLLVTVRSLLALVFSYVRISIVHFDNEVSHSFPV